MATPTVSKLLHSLKNDNKSLLKNFHTLHMYLTNTVFPFNSKLDNLDNNLQPKLNLHISTSCKNSFPFSIPFKSTTCNRLKPRPKLPKTFNKTQQTVNSTNTSRRAIPYQKQMPATLSTY